AHKPVEPAQIWRGTPVGCRPPATTLWPRTRGRQHPVRAYLNPRSRGCEIRPRIRPPPRRPWHAFDGEGPKPAAAHPAFNFRRDIDFGPGHLAPGGGIVD